MFEKLQYYGEVVLIKIGAKRHLSPKMAHWYWTHPGSENFPSAYAESGTERSQDLVECINKLGIEKTTPILEIGCNAGRNLVALWNSGYTHLTGLDINQSALDEFKKRHPEIMSKIRLICNTAENEFRQSPPQYYSVIFSMAVLMHIPYENDKEVFPLIVRALKPNGLIITIEAELQSSSHARVYPRNYKEIFESLGLRQIHKSDFTQKKGYKKRVFKKV